MKQAAANLEYEKAGLLRDRINAVKEVMHWQKMATTVRGEQDIAAFAREGDQAYVQVFFIRGQQAYRAVRALPFKGTRDVSEKQVMTDFVQQFYNSASYIPPLMLLQHPVEDKKVIESWLSSRRGGKVRITVPNRGNKKQMVDLVAENARKGMQQLRIKQLSSAATLESALQEIQEELKLPNLPARMECYDISNIQGKGRRRQHGRLRGRQAEEIRLPPLQDQYGSFRQ